MKPKRLKNFLKYLSLILLFAGCASTPNAVNSALEAYRNGDFKTAVRMYAIAENEGDDFASNHIQEIIDAYLGSLQYRKLINYCANIIKQEDIGSGSFRKTVAYTYQGLSYYFLGDRKRALENYDNALRIDPGNFEAQGYRGDIDIPIDAYSAYMMGDIYRRKAVSAARFPGDIDKALVNYTGAIELYPAFTGAYIRRGALYAAAKEYDKALVDFESAVNANPDQDLLAATYNDMGVVYLQMGDLARAASCYELSINAKGDYIIAYTNIGLVYRRLGRYEEALTSYEAIINIANRSAAAETAFINMGLIYEHWGDFAKAASCYEQAKKISGRSFWAAEAHLATLVPEWMEKGMLLADISNHLDKLTLTQTAPDSYAYKYGFIVFSYDVQPDSGLSSYSVVFDSQNYVTLRSLVAKFTSNYGEPEAERNIYFWESLFNKLPPGVSSILVSSDADRVGIIYRFQ